MFIKKFKNKFSLISQIGFLTLICGSILVNFLGVFAPELGFDALWYHLPIAKIYLNSGHIFHIPGGLLYYSAMPRHAEILYIPLIKLMGDTGPHLLNFSAGVGICLLIYLISLKYLNKTYSFLAVIIFYVTPLVGWQSGSAYVDLIRAFWETLAIALLFNKKYILTGIVLGLAISTKTLSLGTLPINLILAYFITRNLYKTIQIFVLALLVGLPWYLLSFLNTGFPFYPIGAGILDIRLSTLSQILHPLSIVTDYWKVFLIPEDLITPIFVIIVPFAILKIRTLLSKYPLVIGYWLLSYFVWYLIPRTGGGRFLLPYLPIWTIFTVIIISLQNNFYKKILISCVILISIINIVYRIGAEYRLKDYLLGKENKQQYLCHNLNFNFGDFADCDGFFAKNIKSSDLVLIKGVHNLAYVNFPFIHESWYRNEKVNYILVQGKENNDETKGKLVYQNSKTHVKLYKII